MKKLLMFVLLLPLCALAQDASDEAFAQGTPESPSFKNRRGLEMLPQAGDWSIGIDATVGLDYFGNLLSGGTNNNGDWWQYQETAAPRTVILGKYFTSATFAFRGGVELNYNNNVDFVQVNDDNATGPDQFVDDVVKTNSAAVTILVGAEKRKGTGRIQGVYGADVFFAFASNSKWQRDYANSITATNPTPSGQVTSIPSEFDVSASIPSQGYRITEIKEASDFGIGARAFIGVEYFIFPKMSLGGKFTWGISYTDKGASSVSSEAWNPQSDSVDEYKISADGGSNFDAGIGNAGASITAQFYF